MIKIEKIIINDPDLHIENDFQRHKLKVLLQERFKTKNITFRYEDQREKFDFNNGI